MRADHQLQQALRLNASRDELTPTSRKHSRSRSGSSCSTESDGITDVSGRFDDADEFDSCNDDDYYGDGYQHSVKRRRSNDWPAQNHQKGQDSNDRGGGSRYHENSFSRRWRLYHNSGGYDSNGRRSNYNNSTGSPRATAAGTNGKNGPLPRPRRSRFVEGSMNDSVSEKPPSIFLRDDWHLEGEKGLDHTTGASHKSSGIFRFGKAIASAFNPFGGWGSVSDVWKGGSAEENQQQHQQPENDDIARVQQAYEELKKAGFKGTVKGAYTQGGVQAESSNLPDQTWKAIQEKMDYKQPPGAVNHLRQTSGESQNTTSSTSIRTLTDLRKAKSSLGITSVKNKPGRGSEESECPDLRKQKSRKDILRQAKLLKKVSNLEDKLTRAKRELSELRGDQKEEEPVPPRTMALEAIAQEEKPYYPKKFVPGALPTLPSERCLEEQAAAEDNEISALPPLPSPLRNASPTLPHGNKHATTPKSTPKSKTKSPKGARQSSASLTTDSPSLKRKSPDPESLESAQVAESSKQDNDQNQPMVNSDPLSTITNTTPGNRLRKAKFQKMGKGDSPGSVERKQSQERVETVDNSNNLLTPGTGSGRGKGRRKPRYLNPTSPKSSPSARRPPSVTTTPSGAKSGPSLRMKKGQRDLRSASADIGAHTEAQGDRMDCDDDDFDGYSSSSSPSKSQHPHQDMFYMQGQHHLDPDQNTTSPSPSPSKSRSRSRSRSQYEYIPPVPPLPKDLAATAAKVDRRLAKELGRRKGSLRRTAQKEDFEWPEDIF